MDKLDLEFKIVYCLVSSLKDTYAEQCWVSIYSVRKIHPDAWITVVMDDTTHAEMEGIRKEILTMANEVIVEQFAEDVIPLVRSRVLKTTLRQRVQGDFLYIDTDTVCVKPLTGLNKLLEDGHSIHSVHDTHGPVHKMSPGNIEFHTKNAKMLGYDIMEEDNHFFNSGVSLVKDDEMAYRFYKSWNANYFKYLEKLNIKTDQATLSLTNREMEHVIHPMSKVYNFQIMATIYELKKACIIHYFVTGNTHNSGVFPMQNNDVLEMVRTNPIAVKNIVDEIIENPEDSLNYVLLMYNYVNYNSRLCEMTKKICKYLIQFKCLMLKK